MHGTAWSAHAHWLLGDDDAALSAARDAIELARSIDHPYNLAVALAYGHHVPDQPWWCAMRGMPPG